MKFKQDVAQHLYKQMEISLSVTGHEGWERVDRSFKKKNIFKALTMTVLPVVNMQLSGSISISILLRVR